MTLSEEIQHLCIHHFGKILLLQSFTKLQGLIPCL